MTSEQMNFLNTITNYVIDQVGDIEDILKVEENAGSLWIDLKDGTTKSVMIIDTEDDGSDMEEAML